MNTTAPVARTYISPKHLAEALDISQGWLWQLTAKGKLPRPKYFGRREPRWDWLEVQAAIREMPSKSDMRPLKYRTREAAG